MSGNRRPDSTAQALFGSTGWLFADLMLALAMAFLVASTVGREAPPVPTTTTLPPRHSPPPSTVPSIELPKTVLEFKVDYQALLSNDRRVIAEAQRRVRAKRGLAGRRAGLVQTYGGTSLSDPSLGVEVARSFNDRVLEPLGRRGFVFQGAGFEEYHDLGKAPGSVEVDIFLFKN